MTSRAVSALAETLGVTPEELSFMDRLDDHAAAHLDELVTLAVVREDEAVADSLERTLRFLPRPIRGRARSLLMPEES